MAEAKTKVTSASVEDFLNGVEPEQKRQDCFTILRWMEEITQLKPQMWGESMVGFGQYHYVYASGREGDAFLIGFSPRKQNIVLYIVNEFEQFESLLQKLGKFSTGKVCLYIKKLADVDNTILKELITVSYQHIRQTHLPPAG